MLRILATLLRIVLSLKCLVINNVKDVKPFPRIYHLTLRSLVKNLGILLFPLKIPA